MKTVTSAAEASLEDVPGREEFLHAEAVRWDRLDVVEVAPQYDGPGQVTALFAANAIFEMLSMVATRKHGGAGAAPRADGDALLADRAPS